jgi:iron(III) transport system substrate-binding protein
MIRALCVALLGLFVAGCAQRREQVILYTSQDQFYAEPILAEFTKETGIEVRPVFDTESAKTAALAHRLRAEKNNPQCDVFWSNEEMHSRLLVADGVLDSNEWRRIGYRTRRIVFNTKLLNSSDVPKTLLDLADAKWKGKVALAYPLFGTTSFHFLALRQHWGDAVWREWCSKLVANGAKIVDGNSVVVKLVGAGECALGLTDSDDVAAGQRQGLPIAAVPDFEESLSIANSISILNGAPHPTAARALADFLARPATLEKLVALGAIEGLHPASVKSLPVDWSSPLANLDEMNEILKQIFLRS